MKKFLLLLILVGVAARLSAQTPPQAKKAPAKVDTSKQDRMPVIKPNTNSTMPVLKPRDNSPMPIVKPKPIL